MLCGVYNLSLREVGELTPSQFNLLTEWVDEWEARRAYPIAQLEAAVRNHLGGKGKEGEGKTVPLDRLYTAEELLPPFARFVTGEPEWSEFAINDFRANSVDVPDWAWKLVPLKVRRMAH